ncbi:unnamed protein product [Acanthoscelides obtectus]|uniref:Endonuclease/exonuclease/phosphatase domain-containing protein n=1 Tax=Acanthoscelides obtectus TaxID=200917 RepID=A0A9P0L4E4_ACAOB|nr:unnamed protein product [Acanthoscelides obtectus]CAK1626257.1 hypothetical protein AOBTE_LOCUS3723 [Acanthoscelides obtectus]
MELLVNDSSPDVLCLTETWLPLDAIESANIDGYTLISCFCRVRRIHGGCAIYVKNSLTAKCIPFVGKASEEGEIEACGLTMNSGRSYEKLVYIAHHLVT